MPNQFSLPSPHAGCLLLLLWRDGGLLVDTTPVLIIAIGPLGCSQLASNAVTNDIDVRDDGDHGEALLGAGLGLLAVRA